MLLRSVGAVLVAALSGTLLLLFRKRSITGRWFEDQDVTDLTPVSSDWMAHNTRDRGQRGE